MEQKKEKSKIDEIAKIAKQKEKIKIKKLTIEEVINQDYGLTVGDLKKFIKEHDIPNNAPVLVQRVEDFYFENNGWGVLPQKSEWYYQMQEMNELIDSGKYSNEDNYPNIKDPEKFRSSKEEMEASKDQYVPAWCCVREQDKNNILLIHMHY